MMNRMLLSLLSTSLMVSSNFAVQHRQSEDFVEVDLNAYFKKHPEGQPAFREAVKHNGNAAWNVAMKTVAYDTLLTSGICGIAAATLAGIIIHQDTPEHTIKASGNGFAVGATLSLPIGLIVGSIHGSYKAHQTLQYGCNDCGNPTTEHNNSKRHFDTPAPCSTAINVGASISFAYGLASYIARLRPPKPFRSSLRKKERLTYYIEGASVSALIATLGVAGYCLYNKCYASSPEDQRIQDTEQNSEPDAEVICTARTLAREYTRTNKFRTLLFPASCTENLY